MIPAYNLDYLKSCDIFYYIGDFVLVEPIEEGEKVKAEIISILYKDQIKYIQEEGKW